jgi:polysaccharide biosynthesis PFTS motif protein
MDCGRIFTWGRIMSSFYLIQKPNAQIIEIGCIWSGNVKKHPKPTEKIIGIFDNSFGGESFVSIEDMRKFLLDMMELINYRKDYKFVFKPKRNNSLIADRDKGILDLYDRLKHHDRVKVLENLVDPSGVIAMSELTISLSFSSTGNETWGADKKALYYDPGNNFRDTLYDVLLPYSVAHNINELFSYVDFWLEMKDWENYRDSFIKPFIDPYCDGEAINRIRKWLK